MPVENTSCGKFLEDFLTFVWGMVPTMWNLTFVALMIFLGSYLGGYAKWFRASDSIEKMPFKNIVFGAAASYMCVPFFSSVIHVDYEAMMMPISAGKTSTFVQQVLLLISVSGIASYLGYALLDGIADKVLQQEIKDEVAERKKQDKIIIEESNRTRAKVLYVEAVSYTESGEKLQSEQLLKQALQSIDEAIAIYGTQSTSTEYYQYSAYKAFILKRMGLVKEALSIIDKLISDGFVNPISLYNKACYMYILRRENSAGLQEIKDLVHKALTCETLEESQRKKQVSLRAKVGEDREPDLIGLFNAEERQRFLQLP